MKQLNQLYHHQHHLPLLVLALIFVLPCIVRGVTITHHDKPAEAKLPAMASIMMKEEEKESLKTLNHNISLPNAERHKRLLPYMNFYLGYNFNQPIKNINNVGIEYQPKEINYPSLPITLTTTKNKDVNIEQQQKYTPFLESNALPGPFIPMVNPPSATRNNHHQVNYIPIIRQQQQVAIERPNYSQIYDKLSQLKQQQQKLHSLNSYNNGQYLIETYEHQQPKKPAQPPNYIPTSVEVVPQQIKYVNANNNHPQQAQQLPIKIYVQENYPQQQQNRPYLQPIRFVQRPKIYLQQEQVQEQVQEKPRHGEKIYLQGGHRIVLEAPVGATPVLTKTYEPKQQQPIYIIDQKVPSSNPPQQLTKLRPVITTYEEPLPQRFTQKPKLQQVFFIQKQHPQINNNKQQQQQPIIPIQHQQVSPQQPQHHQYIQMNVNNNVKQVSIQQPDLPVPAVASLQQQQQEQMPVVHPPAPVPVPMQKYETFKYHPVSLADYQKYETATEHFATTEKYAPHLQQYTTINEQDVINPGPNFKYKYPEITVQQTYAPTEKYQIQNGQPQQHHKYQTIQKFREEEEEQNTLAQILKKLQETNTLPQTFTPQNIDNSIRTLVKILSSLKKQNKFEKPIIVSENQGLEYEDEDNEAGVNLGDIPGALSAPGDTPEGGTPGKAGVDYPALSSIPQTSFNCKTQRYKGFFGDPDTNCQVWHYCDLNGGQASFLCPNGTIFSQVALTCDWWFNVKCSTTPQLYVLNERLYKYILPLTPKFPEDYSGPLVDRYLALKFKEMEDKMRKERKGATTKDPGPDEAQELINHEEKKSQKSQINNKLQQQTAEGQEDEEEDGIEVRIEAQAEDQDQELIQEETSTELN